MPDLVKLVRIKEDTGTYEPDYEITELSLWSDGSVTWTRSAQHGVETTPSDDRPVAR